MLKAILALTNIASLRLPIDLARVSLAPYPTHLHACTNNLSRTAAPNVGV